MTLTESKREHYVAKLVEETAAAKKLRANLLDERTRGPLDADLLEAARQRADDLREAAGTLDELRDEDDFEAFEAAAAARGEVRLLRAVAAGAAGTDDETGLPILLADPGDLGRLGDACWEVLRAADAELYRYGGLPSRLERHDDGALVVRPLTVDTMRHVLARAARWKKTRKTLVDAAPPLDAVRDVLAHPAPPLPVLARIINAPVMSADGSLVTEPGYDPSGVYLDLPPELADLDVPERPTGADVRAAVATLTEPLDDFPFEGAAERAHALALLLLPFVRDPIDGPTPLHLFEKATPGTGATLLVDVATHPASGRPLHAMTAGRDDEENRKRITAKLIGGAPFVLLDNLAGKLDSGALSAAITSTAWEDRILGHSRTVQLPVRCAWIATGNNPQLSNEIARRAVRCRLDAQTDRPWMRTGFRHADLRQHVRDERPALVHAALTLARAWHVAGRPYTGPTLGMFEAWSRTVGGILENAKITGFLDNLDDLYENADTEGAAWRLFTARWHDHHGEADVTARDLIDLTADVLDLGTGDESRRAMRLGTLLRDHAGRHHAGRRIERGSTVRGTNRWHLVVEVSA